MTVVAPGTIIQGRYRVERALGEGGMGVVVVAVHLELGERVAIKVLRADATATSAAGERLRRESRAAARIRGENVARVLDAGVAENVGPFFVMELVHGQSLAKVLAERGKLEPQEAVGYALQACAALAEAHGLGIVHRDVKPSNLLLTRGADGNPLVKVVDFGIAKSEAFVGHTLTETGSFLGSPRYMSPEQAREAKDVDARTDVWSLGAVLYELLTGHVPFEAYTAAGVISRLLTEPPPPMSTYEPGLPEGLEAAVGRMLARERDARFPTIVEAASALAPFGGPDAERLARRVKLIAAAAGEPAPPEVEPIEPPNGPTLITASRNAEPAPRTLATAASVQSSPLRAWLAPTVGAAAVALLVGLALRGAMTDASGGQRSAAVAMAAPPEVAPSAPTTATADASSSLVVLSAMAPSVGAASTASALSHSAPPPPPASARRQTRAMASASATPDDLDYGPRK